MNGEKIHDVHMDVLPSEDEPQMKCESEKPKDSKPPSPKPHMLPLRFS